MLNRIIIAVVGLACLLVGALFGSLGIPPVAAVGAFLATWAWVIGTLAGLYSFATGRTAIV